MNRINYTVWKNVLFENRKQIAKKGLSIFPKNVGISEAKDKKGIKALYFLQLDFGRFQGLARLSSAELWTTSGQINWNKRTVYS